MAQTRSAKIVSMIKWIQTGRLSIKNSLSLGIQSQRVFFQKATSSVCRFSGLILTKHSEREVSRPEGESARAPSRLFLPIPYEQMHSSLLRRARQAPYLPFLIEGADRVSFMNCPAPTAVFLAVECEEFAFYRASKMLPPVVKSKMAYLHVPKPAARRHKRVPARTRNVLI